ncbi:MAG: UvrB/UvrC motif-containing protein [Ignavibacteria bacterium]|nr:UvrB/UvrC motif-containing protein [Ignavibacteria bacterium]
MIVVKEAIEREDYERAVQLRDEIRKFEQRQ